MNKGKVTVGMTQFACVPDRRENLKKAKSQIRELAARGAKVICTQELFSGQYFAQIIDFTKYATFGVLICWDEWFPEPTRIMAIKGADFIFYPSAIGSEPDNPDLDTSQTWVDAIRGHGIHNNFYVCACNRVGREDAADGSGFMEFYGRSFVSDPWGKLLTEGKRNEEDLILAELDLDEIKRARDILQFHRDRRVDSYGELLHLTVPNR